MLWRSIAADSRLAKEIKDSKLAPFCLSKGPHHLLIAALRPREISVIELSDRFVISYLQGR